MDSDIKEAIDKILFTTGDSFEEYQYQLGFFVRDREDFEKELIRRSDTEMFWTVYERLFTRVLEDDQYEDDRPYGEIDIPDIKWSKSDEAHGMGNVSIRVLLSKRMHKRLKNSVYLLNNV